MLVDPGIKYVNIIFLFFFLGRHLGEKERVSSQIVANWFANRRKEIKKMAREGKIYLELFLICIFMFLSLDNTFVLVCHFINVYVCLIYGACLMVIEM